MTWYERGALFLLLLIPLIGVAYIWMWVSPVGFWQMLVMIIVSIVLYVIFLIAELIAIAVLVD